jgi:hypothetical protein
MTFEEPSPDDEALALDAGTLLRMLSGKASEVEVLCRTPARQSVPAPEIVVGARWREKIPHPDHR